MYIDPCVKTEDYIKRILKHDPAVIKAWTEGKTIQFFMDHKWSDHATPDWSASAERYRVKPEPVYEWEVSYEVLTPSGSRERSKYTHWYNNKRDAKTCYDSAKRQTHIYSNVTITKKEVKS